MPAIIRAFRPEDYGEVVVLRNAALPRRPVSVDSFRREDARQTAPAGPVWARFVAEDPDRGLSGYGDASPYLGVTPGRFKVFVNVAGESRGQGTGSGLLREVEDWARSRSVEGHLTAFVAGDDPGSLTWAQRRGYVIDLERSEAVLDLASWSRSSFAGYVDRVQASGLRLLVEEEPLPEGLLRRAYAVEASASQDEPGFEGEALPWQEWRIQFGEPGSTKLLALVMDGERVVGVSQVSRKSVPGSSAHTNFTGVLRDYRGRGVAVALKLLTIEAARARGVSTMTANNDSENLAMLAVNRKLGYQIMPGPRRLGKVL